jgi:hypothetical protein
MTEELDVLRIISERLRVADVPFILTGSFALGYYGKPRMTRDLDFVVALMERHVDALVSAFSTDFYINEDAARSAIKSRRTFNLMHRDSAIKIDMIVRKNSEYRHAEFERRKPVEFAGISTWIASREDLILSKLVWARDTGSEMQQVNDTSPEMDKMVAERYKLMTPNRRMRIASSMFETARAIIDSSLPLNLTRRERRLAFAKRLYAGELPDAALLAFAEWNG